MMNLRLVFFIGLTFFSYRAKAGVQHSIKNTTEVSDCDVLIAGGSLAALAAAITAANTTISGRICLTEPTDWLGGQLTSSNVPPDFGEFNKVKENLPQSFVSLLNRVTSPVWSYNPGMCWVSIKCFQAFHATSAIRKWLEDDFAGNLRVYYNTVISDSNINSETGNIDEVVAIKRSSKSVEEEWSRNLSEELPDWYSTEESDSYFKTSLRFSGFQSVVEATEFGDILMTSGVRVAQGYEYPTEDGPALNTGCGQSAVLPFYMSYGVQSALEQQLQVPRGDAGSQPYTLHGDLTWEQMWTYRRALAVNVPQDQDVLSQATASPGEQSNINLDNDYGDAYIFLPFSQLFSREPIPDAVSDEDYGDEFPSSSIPTSSFKSTSFSPLSIAAHLLDDSAKWAGGINLAALKGMEQRSYGYFHFMAQASSDQELLSEHGQDISRVNCSYSSEAPLCYRQRFLSVNYTQVLNLFLFHKSTTCYASLTLYTINILSPYGIPSIPSELSV